MASPTTTTTSVRPAAKRPESPVRNDQVQWWIDQCVELCQPDRVYYVNGSKAEQEALAKLPELEMAAPFLRCSGGRLFSIVKAARAL